MRHRRLARVAALAALLPLAACTVEGDVFVHRGDTYSVDVTLSYPAAREGTIRGESPMPIWWVDPCGATEGQAAIVSTRLGAPAGETACRLLGTLDPTAFDGWLMQFILATSSDDHVFIRVPPVNRYLGVPTPIRDLDVTVHLPGEVVAVSGAGQAFGDTVRLTDAEVFWADGVAVTAEVRPSGPGWLVPGVAGLVWGAALAAALLWLRRRDPASEAAVAPAAAPPDDLRHPRSPAPPEDPSVWAPDA